jgi:hypothetical protein
MHDLQLVVHNNMFPPEQGDGVNSSDTILERDRNVRTNDIVP